MRRCPDCGFRVKDPEFRTCPLCGVRLHADPDGKTVQYKVHVHEQKGESCMLPNQNRQTAEKDRYRRIMEQQHRAVEQAKKEDRDWRGDVQLPKWQKPEKTQLSSKTVMAIVFVVLWIMFEACSGWM